MLVALNEEKERVLATTALRKIKYFCPVCGKQVILVCQQFFRQFSCVDF